MTPKSQWVLVVIIVGVLAAALVGGVTLSPALGPPGVESKVPAFEAVRLPAGDTVSLDRYEGEVILLNIWATWCAPCEAEMPSIERLHREMAPLGLRVVAVSIDAAPAERVMQWVRDRDLTFEILHDQTGRIERIFHTTGVPETFVIDKNGIIAKKVIGPAEWDHPAHTILIRELLGVNDSAATQPGS